MSIAYLILKNESLLVSSIIFEKVILKVNYLMTEYLY